MKEEDHSTQQKRFSRRSFLKGVGAVGTAPLVSSELFGQDNNQAFIQPTTKGIRRYAASGASIELHINGKALQVRVTPSTTLLDALREQLKLTGAKEVCDRGACGACTVLLDGRSVNGCMVLAIDAIGKQITTVEGLANADGQLDPVQQAFVNNDACQCGYCIPGMVVRARALLDENPHPSLNEIKQGLSGNICRCATYTKIIQAVSDVGQGVAK